MPEFNGHNFGNLPPGCFEEDPEAPWNEDDRITEDELIDALYAGLEHFKYNPKYKGMGIEVDGWHVTVE